VTDFCNGYQYWIRCYAQTGGKNQLGLDSYKKYFLIVNNDIIQKTPLSLQAGSSKHWASQLLFPGDFITFSSTRLQQSLLLHKCDCK